MSIIERTELLKLTQYSGSSLMAQFVLNYNEDMRKIDAHFSDYEDAINQRVSDLQDVVDASVATVNAMDGRVTTLEQCCEDVNTTLLNYGSRLIEIERVIDTVSTANIDDLTERVNALENKVETNITDIRILRNDIHEVSERVTVTENTLVQHSAQLTNHENRITVLESCCSEVRGELVRIEGKVDSNKSEIDALKLRVTTNEGNIAANAQDITILSGQVSVNTADIEELKQGLAELDPTSQLEVVRQVAINTENISSLQTAVNAQASNLTSVTNRVANAETDIVDLKADNVVLHNEIAQVQGWESRIAGVESQVSNLGDDVDAVEATVAQFSTDLSALDTRVGTNESDISAIKTKNLEYDSKIATDEAALSALTARVGANEADLVSIHQTITDDETGLSNAVSRISALETQNGNTPLGTTAQTLSGGVNEVNTKATNADSKATQALSTASSADSKADSAIADAAQVASDLSNLEGVVGDANSGLIKDVADNASDISDINALIPSTASTSNKLATANDLKVNIVRDAEVEIGTFFGNTLYRKTVIIDTPADSQESTSLSISSVLGNGVSARDVRRVYGVAWSDNSYNSLLPFPCWFTTNAWLCLYLSTSTRQIVITRSGQYSANPTKFTITFEYTKTNS